MNDADKQALSRLAQGAIMGGGEITRGILELIGKWIEAWGRVVTSLDPTALAGWVAANTIVLDFFTTTEPWKSILSELGVLDLLNRLNLVSFITHNLSPDQVGKDLGRDDVVGEWGIIVIGADGNPVNRPQRWYTNKAARDFSFVTLNIPGAGQGFSDLWPIGPGTAYRKVHRFKANPTDIDYTYANE